MKKPLTHVQLSPDIADVDQLRAVAARGLPPSDAVFRRKQIVIRRSAGSINCDADAGYVS